MGPLLFRAEQEVKKRHNSATQDLSDYLDTSLDLGFLSRSLEEKGLRLGHVLGVKKYSQPPGLISLQVVMDLQSVVKHERLPKTAVSKLIKLLTGSNEQDKRIVKSVEKVMADYKTLKDKHKKSQDLQSMLSLFCASNFQTLAELRQKNPTCSTSTSDSKTHEVEQKHMQNRKLLKKNESLLHTVEAQKEAITSLNEVVTELSMDKKNLKAEVDKKTALQEQVTSLKEKVTNLQTVNHPRHLKSLERKAKLLINTERAHRRLSGSP